jgi:Na+/glutamate symporter
MSNQGDRFLGGFIAGSLFGGLVGGLVASYLVKKLDDSLLGDEDNDGSLEGTLRSARNLLRRSEDLSVEDAREGLEDKIAELNDAIDQARQQLSHVNQASPD